MTIDPFLLECRGGFFWCKNTRKTHRPRVGALNKTRYEKIAGKKLSFSLHGLFTRFLDDVANRIGRLSTLGNPVVSFSYVESKVDTFFHRVVSADLLDVTSIPALAAVYSNDFVERTVFRSLAVESKSKHTMKG